MGVFWRRWSTPLCTFGTNDHEGTLGLGHVLTGPKTDPPTVFVLEDTDWHPPLGSGKRSQALSPLQSLDHEDFSDKFLAGILETVDWNVDCFRNTVP